MDELSPICELGSGTCGNVIKMKHNLSETLVAVKVEKKKFKNTKKFNANLFKI